MQRILLIDDNVEFTRLVNLYLSEKYHTQLVSTLAHAYRVMRRSHFDLVLLDRILPDGDGLVFLQQLRDQHLHLPVIIFSHKSQVEERLRGLRVGADDYLGKPFSIEELLLKVEKQLNSVYRVRQNRIELQNLVVMEMEGKAFVNNKEVFFRSKEFSILIFLIRHEHQVISRNTLIENLWFEQESPTSNTIDVYIRRLRMLLGDAAGVEIVTRRGFGYMFRQKTVTSSPARLRPIFADTERREGDSIDPATVRLAI